MPHSRQLCKAESESPYTDIKTGKTCHFGGINGEPRDEPSWQAKNVLEKTKRHSGNRASEEALRQSGAGGPERIENKSICTGGDSWELGETAGRQ